MGCGDLRKWMKKMEVRIVQSGGVGGPGGPCGKKGSQLWDVEMWK